MLKEEKITVFRQGLHLEEGPGPAFFQMQL
jgi:hypothetical protein